MLNYGSVHAMEAYRGNGYIAPSEFTAGVLNCVMLPLKRKCKVAPVHAMKGCGRSEGRTALILKPWHLKEVSGEPSEHSLRPKG
jgi:hypothetical protein